MFDTTTAAAVSSEILIETELGPELTASNEDGVWPENDLRIWLRAYRGVARIKDESRGCHR